MSATAVKRDPATTPAPSPDPGQQAAVEGTWPLLPKERTWNKRALMGVCASCSAATWGFIIGGAVAFYLPVSQGIPVMLAGTFFGGLMILLGLALPAARYGLDTVSTTKPYLGSRGSYISVALVFASMIGWNTLLIIFLGRASSEILISAGIFGEGARDWITPIAGLVGLGAVWSMLRRGPETVRDTGPVIALGVAVLSVLVLVLLINKVGWDKISDAKPLAPSDDKQWNIVTGFELMVATMLSWWPLVGGMIRMGSGPRKSLWPTLLGLGIPVCFVSFVGFFAGLAIKDSGGDPTVFLTEIGGVGYGIPALLFIILANVGTVLVGIFITAVAIRQVPALQRKLSWVSAVTVTALPTAIVIIAIPDVFFDNFPTFLAFCGVIFAPLVGIGVVDYFLLRKGRIDMRAIFVEGPGTPYHYWGGVNPAGVVALVAGFGTYLYLLDPVAYTSRSPYEYLGAAFPSSIVAGIVFAVLTVLVRSARRGGYPERTR